MLRQGHHPVQVADVTGVPLALVHLIDAERHPLPANPRPTPPAGPTLGQPGSAPDEDRVRSDLAIEHTDLVGSRWEARICRAAGLTIVGNLSLVAAAYVAHIPVLAMAAVVLTPLLLTILGLCAIACAARG